MTTTVFQQLLSEHRIELLADWINQVSASGKRRSPHDDVSHALESLLRSLFDDILAVLERPPTATLEFAEEGSLALALRQLVTDQARHGSDASECVGVILALKHLLSQRLMNDAPLAASADLLWLEQVFEQLTLLAFGSFVAIRERQITQQSLSLLELSTPVLRLWHRILLLPLIGVIDTGRARQITENLLEAIARHEARVTILDLTGVPILDTSVAQHLMKTIDAARLLGTRVVMTGISPEGAQTLTKLGIRFADVISRATLRAGIAEALLLVGQRIAPLEEPRR
ncbi:STAS domain-containing protein [Thiocystis violascens]|uniref:Anti-anti-sigma regulatory factor (Antagonist of anti-sigma factor) n=1 Tax=Thiocystis violascens (strain ATCC 17096 / DSM 198 / 6111) TaxID=765911 RepID=I3Y5Y2_THIV6|nr:STAS domain-containing protein [Thiocystis violascens]AFL72400.1 anti-anti-sigma regulatory factor (antagonist of anti-sigma factor) [Thiocystis violascens DSM 198]